MAMAISILLQLFSTCGLCCNRDTCKNFKKKSSSKREEEREFDDLNGDSTMIGRSNDNINNQSSMIEMPDKVNKFKIRARNYEIDWFI